MDMPIELTRQLMRKRESDTNTTADIHEQDLEYLAHCRDRELLGMSSHLLYCCYKR